MRSEHLGRGGHRPGGLHRGRRLTSEDLQLVLLALLAQRPYHGYELIKQLGERSSGFYSPSSGMVYPALAFLVDIGHAVVDAQGMKKSYSLTDEGRAYLAMHQATADAILADLERTGARMAQVRRVFDGDEADTVVPGTPEDLMLARYTLKQALMQAPCTEPAEARRIAAILRRAASDILGR